MIKKIKNFIKSPDTGAIIKNVLSLSTLQMLTYILPLITLPYLTRVLGPEKYGLTMFAAAFINYFKVLTDYGFNLSATKEISIHREDKTKMNAIFNSVMVIKLILGILSFIILFSTIMSINKFNLYFTLYIITFGTVIGDSLFPVWFFQGIEKMGYITYFNIISKTVATILIFVTIRSPEDYLNLAILNSACSIVIGLVTFFYVVNKFKFVLKMPSIKEIKIQLIEGWYVFISSISIVLYTTSTTFILGIFTSNTIVGYYAAADKIRLAIQGLFAPIFQSIYPYLNKVAQKSKDKALMIIKIELKYLGSLGLIASILTFAISPFLVSILGSGYKQSIVILQLLSPSIFFVDIGNITLVHCMLSFNLKKTYSKIYINSSLFGLIVMLILINFYKENGAALAVSLIEGIIVLISLISLNSNKIKLFKRAEIKKESI